MKHKFWKRAAAFALALALVAGVSPVNIGSGGIADRAEIVANAEHAYSSAVNVTSLKEGDIIDARNGDVTITNNATDNGRVFMVLCAESASNTINDYTKYDNNTITLGDQKCYKVIESSYVKVDVEDGTKNYYCFTYTETDMVHKTVTFMTSYGTAPVQQTVELSARATAPTIESPVIDAGVPWRFKGWYADSNYTNQFNFTNTAIDKDTTLYAKWEADKKVQFDVNGFGDTPDMQYVESGKKATQPQIDSYVDNAGMGWNVSGWYKNADCTDAFNFDNDTITADTTLYAKWEKAPYKVTCEPDAANAFTLNRKCAKAGDAITLTLKDGYTFTGDLTVSGASVTQNGNTYSFTMPENDVTVSIPANSITKQEYTITKGSKITSVMIGDEEVTKATVGDTVQFKVDYPKNDDGSPDTTKALKKLTVTGVDGTEVEFEKTDYDTYEVTMPAGNISISAEFADVEKYTVFYFGDNATDGKLVSEGVSYSGVLDGDVVLGNKTVRSMIADATAQDTMRFKYKDEDGWSAWREIAVTTSPDTSNLENQATRLPNGDKVLIIKGETNMVGVSFVADAYTPNCTVNYFTTSGGTVTVPGGNSESEGYVFKCWENRKTGAKYQAGDSVTAPTFTSGGDNTLVLNAIWERAECTVTFDSNGGSSVASQSVSYGNTVVEPSDPTKSGYSFSKWVVAKTTGSLRKGETFDFATTSVTENLTLKAEWTHVHSYNCYTLDAAIFNGKFAAHYDKYLKKAHIKLCDDWDDYAIEAHHFDENGKCKDCGYQLSGAAFIEVVNFGDGTTKKVRKGATCTLTAPERKGNEVFDCWGYIIGDGYEFNTLSKDRTVSFNVPEDDPMTKVTVYPFYKTVLTEPSISMIARPAVVSNTNTKAIQFYADYQLPDGWKATDFVMNVGDNDMLFYFKPGYVNLWTGFKDSFLNMIGKKKLGGYYCFEEVDDSSLGGKIESFFKTTFSKIPVYYPREDDVMTSNKWNGVTLADKMYAGKGITVENMELMGLKLNSPGKSGYIYKNVIPSTLGYGLPKDNDRIFYATGYLKCTDANGKNHTYIIDAISATANDVASLETNKGPVISYAKHEKTN